MIIGITGGIGSGKSTVSAFFEKHGYDIIDADKISGNITAKGSPVLDELKTAFGSGIIDEEGILDRKMLAQLVFGDSRKLSVLNSIITSRVIEQSKALFTEKCIFDAPTLFENKLEYLCDIIITVSADENIRVGRVVARDGRSIDTVYSIIRSQMPENEKIKKSDIVIYNNGSLEELQMILDTVLSNIKAGNFGVKEYGRKHSEKKN